MSTTKEPASRATTATTAPEKRPDSKPSMVLDIIKDKIQSELSPTKNACLVFGKDGKPQGFKAEFLFEGNLRRYLTLQRHATSGVTKRLSSLISFTSAGSDVDALAVPASTYVRDTWGHDGNKILQIIDNGIGASEVREVSAALSHGTQVSITVYKSHLLLKIRGARATFARIIEQVCWLISVAGETPLARLAHYVKETKSGTTTRRYAETFHTGKPVIKAEQGHRFNVSFGPARFEKHNNGDFVAKSGHCWKTMTGFTIIASGYAIPARPRNASGLEAPLSVLRQLLKRGCPGQCLLPSDEPMVMFPPVRVEKGYHVRLIIATGSEQYEQGNSIYWHFDPAKFCDSEESYQRLDAKIGVNSQTIKPNSRHFVGWSNSAGFSLVPSEDTDGVVYSILRRRRHYELVVPTVTATLQIPKVGGVGASLGTEKVTTTANIEKMWDSLPDGLTTVSERLFVLWDTDGCRGWLVHGDVVALHVLKAYLKTIRETRLDFESLKGVKDDPISAYEILNDTENLKRVYWPPIKDGKDKPEGSEDAKSAEKGEKVKERVIGEAMLGIYAALIEMSNSTISLNTRHGLAASVVRWVEKKWATTVRGWDFYDIPHRQVAQVYVNKLNSNPGWLNMARELGATFLFANGIGEILKPRAGSCCRYFRTLPVGHNFLASNMRDLREVIVKYGGRGPMEKTVARLHRDEGWERRLHPFEHPGCQGDHLDKLEPTCFPVQGLLDAPISDDIAKRPQRDMKFLQEKKLYTKGEILAMADEHPAGVVVFGRQPGAKELREIYRQHQQNSNPGTQQRQGAAPTTSQASSRPSSRASAQVSTGSAASGSPRSTTQSRSRSSDAAATRSSSAASTSQLITATQNLRNGQQQRAPSINSVRSAASASEATGAVRSRTGQLPATSTQRTPSTSSVRSTASSTQSRPPNTGPSAERPQASTYQGSAASAHRVASNASLRSNDSRTRPNATNSFTVQSHVPPAQASMQTATRVSSNSGVRTTGSVASRPQGSSQPQAPAGQPSAASLKKTNTNSSDRTTISRSSGSTNNSTASASAANNRQRQHRIEEQLGATTAAAGGLAPGQPNSSGHGPSGTSENPHSTSSGPDPTGGRGSDT